MSFSCAKEYTITVVNPGFQACYACEDVGTTIMDSFGNANMPVTYNCKGANLLACRVAGIVNYGFNVRCLKANSANIDPLAFTGDFTVRAWVNMSYVPPFAGDSYLDVLYDHATDESWHLTINRSASHYGANWVVWDNVPDEFEINNNTVLTPGWHHIVGWVKAGVEIGMRVDTVLIGTTPFLNPIYQPATRAIVFNKSSADYDANDYVDEMRIWNRALTHLEIVADYNGGLGFTCP